MDSIRFKKAMSENRMRKTKATGQRCRSNPTRKVVSRVILLTVSDFPISLQVACQTTDGYAQYAWTYSKTLLKLHAATTCFAKIAFLRQLSVPYVIKES